LNANDGHARVCRFCKKPKSQKPKVKSQKSNSSKANSPKAQNPKSQKIKNREVLRPRAIQWRAFGTASMPPQTAPLKRLSLDEPLASLHPDQILLFTEWCELNRISPRTGRRILASDGGPIVTRLSHQRIGITVANNAKWQASRARKGGA